MTLPLLLAALAQPAWSVAHALVHEHLAEHHAEAETHSHGSANAHVSHEGFTATGPHGDHDHDHDHLVAIPLRATRCDGSLAPGVLPSAALAAPAPPAYRPMHASGVPSRASPETTGPCHPRAPPSR